MLARTAACLLLAACATHEELEEHAGRDGHGHAPPAAATRIAFANALELALQHAGGSGTPFHVELEQEDEGLVWSVDLARGARTFNVVVDAADGHVVEVEDEAEAEDHSADVAACKVTLWEAVEAALARHSGQPVEAFLRREAGRPLYTVVIRGATESHVKVDAASGEAFGDLTLSDEPSFADTFAEAEAAWSSTGRNPFFVLEPGWQLVLEGEEDGETARLTITVLDQTRTVAGVETRVVEEREEQDGELVEVSRNFMAISRLTGAVGYFGEEVDLYEDGRVVKHEGAWLAGEAGARFGLLLPGAPAVGARFYQEVAPGAALDRAEILGLTDTLVTPAGRFEGCLRVRESSALEKGSEVKLHAPGIGLVQEEHLRLVRFGPRGA
jgi:uncharacterized membrane protein YkoI